MHGIDYVRIGVIGGYFTQSLANIYEPFAEIFPPMAGYEYKFPLAKMKF